MFTKPTKTAYALVLMSMTLSWSACESQQSAITDAGADVGADVGADAGTTIGSDAGVVCGSPSTERAGGDLLAATSFTRCGPLAGDTTGTGFLSAWEGAGMVQSAGLVAAWGRPLLTAGGAMSTTGGSGNRFLDLGGLPASFSDTAGKIGAPGQRVYVSFVAHAPSGQPSESFAGVQLMDSDGEKAFIGAPWFDETDALRVQHFGFDRPGLPVSRASERSEAYSSRSIRTASLLVTEITFGVDDDGDAATPVTTRLSLFIDPVPGSARATWGAPDVEVFAPDFRFNQLQIQGSFVGFLIDELRVALTAEAATPPAP